MSESRMFHLGDILSVTTGYLVSLNGTRGVYDILRYMKCGNGWVHKECKSYLLEQFPQLSGDDMLMRAAIAVLRNDIHRSELGYTQDSRETIIKRWLETQIKWYGEFHEVKPIPDAKTSIQE